MLIKLPAILILMVDVCLTMLGLYFHVATQVNRNGSVDTSQFVTPTPPPYQQTYRSTGSEGMLQSNYYDDPSVLDTSNIGLHRSLDALNEHNQYTTMHSSEVAQGTHNSNHSTKSDSLIARNPLPYYDVPRKITLNSEYDDPVALGTQVEKSQQRHF